MTMREIYIMLCKEFNDGKYLEYKYTRHDGYWKMTKGWDNTPYKVMTAKQYLHLCQMIREDKELLDKRKEVKQRGRKKKVHTKYVGDLYE